MGDGVDMVPLEAVAAVAAGLGAAGAVKVGGWAELQGGAQLGADVATEMGHGLGTHAVVGDRL